MRQPMYKQMSQMIIQRLAVILGLGNQPAMRQCQLADQARRHIRRFGCFVFGHLVGE